MFSFEDAKVLSEAFFALPSQSQKKLSEYLNADGVQEKAFLLYTIPNFLGNNFHNKSVGMTRALQLMLRVFHHRGQGPLRTAIAFFWALSLPVPLFTFRRRQASHLSSGWWYLL